MTTPAGTRALTHEDTVRGTDLVFWPVTPFSHERRWTPLNLLDAKDCYMVDAVGDQFNPVLHLSLVRHS